MSLPGQSVSDLFLPTADQTLDNLVRQGFDTSNKANTCQWIQKMDTDLRNKVTFMSTPQTHR